MEEQAGEELGFNQEEVDKIISESIEYTLQGQPYVEAKVPHWINSICEKITEDLVKLEKPYKYIVNCVIQQRGSAGVWETASNYWDGQQDSQIIVNNIMNKDIQITIWPKDKQKELQSKSEVQCIVTVFGLSMLNEVR